MAVGLLNKEGAPLPLTHFQELELRNAFRLKIFRREIQATGAQTALSNLQRDIRDGFFIRPIYGAHAIFLRAEVLSQSYTESSGARTLDILQIAAALELGCTRFVSLGVHQRAVAK